MSDSIWKMPDQKPDIFKPHTILVIYEAHNEAELMLSTQYTAYTADRYINRWCYLDEFIAQADKAERLQKAVDEMYLDVDRFFAHMRGTKPSEYVATHKLGELRAKLWETANN